MTAAEIAEVLRLPLSTVSRWLKQIGLGSAHALSRSSLPIAMSGVIPASSSTSTSRSWPGSPFAAPAIGCSDTAFEAASTQKKIDGRQTRLTGYEYLHVMIDDHSRLAYAELLGDLTAACAVAFLRRGVAWFAERGVEVRAVMSDNGSCYVADSYRAALAQLQLRHLRTRPYRPRTNGCESAGGSVWGRCQVGAGALRL